MSFPALGCTVRTVRITGMFCCSHVHACVSSSCVCCAPAVCTACGGCGVSRMSGVSRRDAAPRAPRLPCRLDERPRSSRRAEKATLVSLLFSPAPRPNSAVPPAPHLPLRRRYMRAVADQRQDVMCPCCVVGGPRSWCVCVHACLSFTAV
jgi:hypothetical protein